MASMAIRKANTIALLLGFTCCSLARINMWSILINKPEHLLPSNKVVNNHLPRECQIMRQWLNKAVSQPFISRGSFPWKINLSSAVYSAAGLLVFFWFFFDLKKKKGKFCSPVGCICFPHSVCVLTCCCIALCLVSQLLYGSPLRCHGEGRVDWRRVAAPGRSTDPPGPAACFW